MYSRLMIVIDSRPVARAAVLEGATLAKALGAQVLFFHVLASYGAPAPGAAVPPDASRQQFEREVKAMSARILAGAVAAADKLGVTSDVASAVGEDAVKLIVGAARRRRCDLIVVSAGERSAVLRALTGSLIPDLVEASPVPVLVCKKRPPKSRAAQASGKPGPARSKTAALPAKVWRKRAAV